MDGFCLLRIARGADLNEAKDVNPKDRGLRPRHERSMLEKNWSKRMRSLLRWRSERRVPFRESSIIRFSTE